VITTAQATALSFNKFDVNNDGLANRLDAAIVDRNIGKNFTLLADVLSTNDDLVAAELNDNNAITTSDFALIRAAVGAGLLGGDANFDGTVNFSDLLILAQNYGIGTGSRIWSTGDFSGDQTTGFDDLLQLAQNYTSGSSTLEEDWFLAQSMVPEPTTFAALGMTLAMLTRRRRVIG
jgi:hypothetical protein